MEKITVSILALVGVIISAGVAYLVSQQQRKQTIYSLKEQFSQNTAKGLFEARLSAYPSIYTLMHNLAYEFKNGNRDIELLKQFEKARNEWDGKNGILLSAWSTHKMIQVRRTIRKIIKKCENVALTRNDGQTVIKEFYGMQSALKTELGVFDMDGHHNPSKTKRLSEILSDLEKQNEHEES